MRENDIGEFPLKIIRGENLILIGMQAVARILLTVGQKNSYKYGLILV